MFRKEVASEGERVSASMDRSSCMQFMVSSLFWMGLGLRVR